MDELLHDTKIDSNLKSELADYLHKHMKIKQEIRDQQDSKYNLSARNEELLKQHEIRRRQIEIHNNARFENLITRHLQEFNSELLNQRKQHASYLESLDKFIKAQEERFTVQLGGYDKDFKEFKEYIQSNYNDIKRNIESLLPEASAVGIAKAFADEMKKRKSTATIHLLISYATIAIIVIVASLFYMEGGFLNTIFGIKDQLTLVNFLKLLSLEAPLAFLATLSAKKSHQNQRIYEEYAHKYTAAMTYVGLCKEVREHEEIYGKDAVKNLNEGFRHAVFRNPSSAIDKKIEDVGTPFELVERLILSVGQPAAEALIKSKEDKGA